MQKCQLLINHACIVTVDDQDHIYEDYSIVIQNDVITDILSTNEAIKKYESDQTIDATHHILMPGFINMHTHIPMTYFRGLADDLPLNVWLEKYIWPNEAKHISEDFVYSASLHGVAELIRNGVTQFNDMYFIPRETAKACQKIGIRAMIADIGLDFPMGSFHQPEKSFDQLLSLSEEFSDDERIEFCYGPHAIYTCAEPTMKKCRDYAEKHNKLVHMHLSETEFEVHFSQEKYNKRPIEYLHNLGLLNERLLLAHAVWLNEEEIELLQKYNVKVIINTESNLKLASGFAPLKSFAQHQVLMSLGTDGVASNNNLSMFDEMSITAKLHKALNQDSTFLPARDIVRMATINGAKSLGKSHLTGSVEIGKKADIILLYTHNIESSPYYDPYSLIVYGLNQSAVKTVIINGKIVMLDREIKNIDENELLDKAKYYKEILRG